jgi:Caspase domain
MGTGTDENLNSGRESDGKSFLIAIGIDDYSGGNARYGDLPSGKTDVKEIVNILTKKYQFELIETLEDKGATKKGITDVFEPLIVPIGEVSTHSKDSLVIYYSGHGAVVETVGASHFGAWVPALCPAKKVSDYFGMDELNMIINQLGFLHVLVIMDCCHSGKFLETEGFFTFSATSPPGLGPEYSPSCTAICSSRSRDKSLAGKPGEMSLFTSVLVKLLKDNTKEKYRTDALVKDITDEFENLKEQKPISGPINVISNNSGIMPFWGDPDLMTIDKKRKYLREGIPNLNFINAKRKFREFGKRKSQTVFTILSGSADCGLRFLARHARLSANFPSPHRTTSKVSPSTINRDPVNLLGMALGRTFASESQCVDYISELLTRENIVFEINYYAENRPEENDDDMPAITPSIKKDIVLGIAKTLEKVSGSADQYLYVFLVDEEHVNYETLFGGNNTISTTPAIYVPPIPPMTVDDADDWYETEQAGHRARQGSIKPTEFNHLFDDVIGKNLGNIIAKTNGVPAKVIREICDKSNCMDLSSEILDPK